MYFEKNVAGQASRHDGTTCMDNHTHTHANMHRYMLRHPKDTRAHTSNVRLKELTPVLI